MKKALYLIIPLIFTFLQLFSQVPEKFNYQGVLRNSSGELVKNTSITVKMSLLQGSTFGAVLYSESHTTTTNHFGQFGVQIGSGTVVSGNYSTIDWSQQMYQKTEVANPAGGTLVDMGTTQLIAVPYSLYSGKAKVLDNKLLYFTDTDTLFAVKDREGNIVFAVFPDGARVYTSVNSKGTVGGFAVSGRTPAKAGGEVDYFRVTSDSTRIYVNDSISGKGKVGGFAVSGRTPAKGIINDYLFVTADSTRIYVNDTISGKGKVGGFAVSGRTPAKGEVKPFMNMTKKNYFIGHEAGISNSTGEYNSFFGYKAGLSNTVGTFNIFIGHESGLSNIDGWANVFIGDSAGFKNTSGSWNVAIGPWAGQDNTTGSHNISIGGSAGIFNQSGSHNICLGQNTGVFNTTGGFNVNIGNHAGYRNTIGNRNISIGYFAGGDNTIGENNVNIGMQAGLKNLNGDRNTNIGSFSGMWNSAGSYNVTLGNSAAYLATEGSGNVYLGTYVGMNNLTGSWNVFIGYEAGYYETSSNRLYISNSSTTTPIIYGEFDNAKLKFNANVNIRDFMVLEPQNTAPTSPVEGTVYFDNNDKKMKAWDGTTWQSLW